MRQRLYSVDVDTPEKITKGINNDNFVAFSRNEIEFSELESFSFERFNFQSEKTVQEKQVSVIFFYSNKDSLTDFLKYIIKSKPFKFKTSLENFDFYFKENNLIDILVVTYENIYHKVNLKIWIINVTEDNDRKAKLSTPNAVLLSLLFYKEYIEKAKAIFLISDPFKNQKISCRNFLLNLIIHQESQRIITNLLGLNKHKYKQFVNFLDEILDSLYNNN